jgi:dephospho-CoA kinase
MAAGSAHITALEVLAVLREACAHFHEVAQESLVSMDGDFRRALGQLEQLHIQWQAEVKKQEENVTQAKLALNRKKLSRMFGHKIDATVEEEEFRKAKRKLEYAQEKVVQVKKWLPRLEKAELNYSGARQMLMTMLETDLLKGMNFLENKLIALEAYVRLTVPQKAAPPPSEP